MPSDGAKQTTCLWGEPFDEYKFESSSAQTEPMGLTYLNAASRERFPLGVPHESHRYMQAEKFDKGRQFPGTPVT